MNPGSADEGAGSVETISLPWPHYESDKYIYPYKTNIVPTVQCGSVSHKLKQLTGYQ